MQWSLHYREFIRGLSGYLEAELDHWAGVLNAWAANVTTGTLTAQALVLGGATQPQMRIARTTTAFSVTSSASIQNVTGLSHTVSAGQTYAFEAVLFMSAGAAGGYRVDINGTCTATDVRYHILILDDDTDVILVSSTETALGSNRNGATPVSTLGVIRGTITVSVGGVLRVGFAQSGASGTASVVAQNSRFTIWEIPS